MARPLFNWIVEEVTSHSLFFRDNIDCTGREGISPLLKCTSAIRQLAYDIVPDFLDEYLQMHKRTSRLSLDHFLQSGSSLDISISGTCLVKPKQSRAGIRWLNSHGTSEVQTLLLSIHAPNFTESARRLPKLRNLCVIHAPETGVRTECNEVSQFPLHSCFLVGSTSAMKVSNWRGHLHFCEEWELSLQFIRANSQGA
ncbi:hypothetical protein Tco_0633845 [Tanacetum coccineum]